MSPSKPDAILTRHETSDEGTFGTLSVGSQMVFSGELPWKDNLRNCSCIPTGLYTCNWTYSPRFKRWMYEVVGVKDRSSIRIHSANFMGDDTKGLKKQLNGCISLGMKLGKMENQKAILLSSTAVRQFETIMAGKTFILEIR